MAQVTPLKPEQFIALSALLRLRNGPAQVAVYNVMVEGMTVPDAAHAAGITYKLAYYALRRAQDGFELAKTAVLAV